jgi:hypothetical protein
MMTVHEFLDVVAASSTNELRQAMTRALRGGGPRSRVEYAEFYRRVVADLRVQSRDARLSAVA